MSYQRLRDKIAFVTGGGSGIGRAIAKSFAEEGAAVCVAGRNRENLEAAVAEFTSFGARALALPMDIRREEEVVAAVQTAIDTFGRVDILVNNSGIGGPTKYLWDLVAGRVERGDNGRPHRQHARLPGGPEAYGAGRHGRLGHHDRLRGRPLRRRTLRLPRARAVLLRQDGTDRPHRDAGPRMRPTRHPGELHDAGGGARRPLRGDDRENGPRRRVSSFDEALAAEMKMYSLKRPTVEYELGQVAVFLASDESSAITGQTIPVNCGMNMWSS